MPSATARGGDGRCLSKRALRNPVRVDGRLARQLGRRSSGQATGLAAASWRPMFSQSAAYTELPVRRWPPAGARPRAHSCGSCAGGAQPPGDPRGATPDCTDHASRRYRPALRAAGCGRAGGVPRWLRRGSVAALTARVMVDAAGQASSYGGGHLRPAPPAADRRSVVLCRYASSRGRPVADRAPGSVSTNVAPPPGPDDSAHRSPPCARASPRAMVRPTPDPDERRDGFGAR